MGTEGTAVAGVRAPQVGRWRYWRVALAITWLVALAAVTAVWGFPASRDRVLIFVLAALLIVVVGRPHALGRLVVDFTPVILFLYAYDLLRGQAEGLVGHVFVEPQLKADEWLFGGTAPTVTLQRALWTPGHAKVWDYAAFFVYLSYFLVPIVVAAILWRYRHQLFRRFVTLWIGLSFAALLTYALYPAAPPWIASHEHHLQHITRITVHMSSELGTNFSRVMGSRAYVNKVAAVPSLHAATILFISLFFWSRTRRWRWLLALYPLAMGFSLVYLGEHYFSDVWLGWLYAIVVFVVGGHLYDRLTARRAAARASASASSSDLADYELTAP